MVYHIKEEFWSRGDDFAIADEDGNDSFYVKGMPFTWGTNLSFQDDLSLNKVGGSFKKILIKLGV